MKKSILFASALVIGLGGAFAQQGVNKVQKPESTYVYYQEGACNVQITCSDQFEGPSCVEVYESSVLYDQQGCDAGHQVAIPQGKLPL